MGTGGGAVGEGPPRPNPHPKEGALAGGGGGDGLFPRVWCLARGGLFFSPTPPVPIPQAKSVGDLDFILLRRSPQDVVGTRHIDTAIGVCTEQITLALRERGWKPLGTQAVEIRER